MEVPLLLSGWFTLIPLAADKTANVYKFLIQMTEKYFNQSKIDISY